MDFKQTLIAAANKDERALESLLVENLPALEMFVRLKAGRALRAKESFSDLVQTVCLDVMRDIDEFEYQGEGAFRNWLFQRALHKILNKHRFYSSKKRDPGREVALDDESREDRGDSQEALARAYLKICSPSQAAMGHEALHDFERAFQKLPDDYREAITLNKIVGLEYPQIAESMERSEGAVRNLVYRGLARLSIELEDDEDDEDDNDENAR